MTVPGVPVRVVVEVFALSVPDGQLHWQARRAPLSGLAEPDALARELAGILDGRDVGVVLHSTSWRHTGTELVVTYAVFPASGSAAGGQPLHHHLVTGPGPLHPSPVDVGDEHVAAHAARHLAYLAADRDPHVMACAGRRPFEWQVLAEHARQVHVEHDDRGPSQLKASQRDAAAS